MTMDIDHAGRQPAAARIDFECITGCWFVHPANGRNLAIGHRYPAVELALPFANVNDCMGQHESCMGWRFIGRRIISANCPTQCNAYNQ